MSLAIYVAASSINSDGKIHGHQRRVGYKASKNFTLHLQTCEDEIKQAENFDELLTMIKSNKTYMIGSLTVYDTAERIGAFLGLFPTKVYLHCGVREGAIRLLGTIGKKKSLKLTDFPLQWQKSNLNARQIENILCIYKNHMNPNLL